MKAVKLPKQGRRVSPAAQGLAPAKVLVPVDFSKIAQNALMRARTIAGQFGSELILIHAVEPVIQPVEFAIVPAEMQEVNIRHLANRKERLLELRAEIEKENIACRVEARLGKPWQVIVDAARKLKADLIVIGTHGRTGAKHLFLGSTAERVVQHAPCSVLVVR